MQLNDLPVCSASCESIAGELAPILAVAPQTSVGEVIALMSQTQSSCAFVVEATAPDRGVVGIFTERDVLRLAGKGELGKLRRRQIARVMTQPVIAISPAEARDVWKVHQVLCQHQIRHLPVVDGGRLVGLLTLESVLHELRKTSRSREGSDSIPSIASLRNRAAEETSGAPPEPLRVPLPVAPLPLERRSILNRQPLQPAPSPRSIPAPTGNESDRFRHLIDRRFSDIIYSEFGELIKARLSQPETEEISVKQLAETVVPCDRLFSAEMAEEVISLQAYLLDRVRSAIVATDASGKIIYWNKFAEQLYQWSAAEVMGQSVIEVLCPDNNQTLAQEIMKSLSENEVWEGEFTVKRKDGSSFVALVRDCAIKNNQGQTIGIVGVSVDITERKRAEEDLQKYRDRLEELVQTRTREKTKAIVSLLKTNQQLQQEIAYRKEALDHLRESERLIQQINDNTPHIVYLYDLQQQRSLYVNRQFTQLLGYSPDALLKTGTRFLKDKLHPDEKQAVEELIRRLDSTKEGEAIEGEYRVRHASGAWRWLQTWNVVFKRDENGEPLQILGAAADITDRKQTDEALKKSEERYRAFVAQSSEAIYRFEFEPPVPISVSESQQIQLICTNGYLAECNDVVAQMYGFESASEMLDRGKWDFHSIWASSATRKQVQELIRSGYRIAEMESQKEDSQGKPRYFLNNWLGIVEGGFLVRMWGTQLEISDRKRAQRALVESEARYRLLAENATDMISRHSPDGIFQYVSPACKALLGCEPEELLGRSLKELCHPLDTDDIAATTAAIQTQAVSALSYRIARKNGEYIWFETTLRAARNPQTGAAEEIIAVSRDITRRKQAEEALRQSEERLTSILNSLQDVVWSVSRKSGAMVYLNPIAETVYGRPIGQLLKNPDFWLESVHPEDRERVENSAGQLMLTGSKDLEYRILRPDGQVRWLRDRAWLVRDSAGAVVRTDGLASDVTARKQAAEALFESEERFRQMAGSIDQVFWIASTDMNQILYISPAYERIWGRSSAQLYEQPQVWWESVHAGDRDRLLVAIARQTRKHGEFNEEFRIIRPDGSVRWIWARSFLIRNERGEVYRRTGVGVDITERKQMEETLLVTQQRLQHLLSSSPAVIYSTKIFGEWATDFISENVTAVLGYQPEEFTQQASFWRDRIHPEDKASVLAQLPQLFQRDRHTCEYRFACKDGSYRWLRDERRLVRDAAGNPLEMVGYWADISAQKAAEEEMRKALAKEKELSQLRSRFITLTSHEFRTPLCTILSSADLLEYYTEQAGQAKEQLERMLDELAIPSALGNLHPAGKKKKEILPLQKLREHVQRIQSAAVHMTQMLNDILVIGKADAGALTCNPQPLDLPEFCQQLVAEISSSSGEPLGEEIRPTHPITFVCPGNCTDAVIDEKLLRHVLGNLLSNAIKYSPQGSPILLELTCQHKEETRPAAIFRITDSGIGIPPEDREKIFDSFYRGNNVGNKPGTGLGLAIVKKALDVQGGQIALESEIGAGTTFTVTLPLCPDSNCSC